MKNLRCYTSKEVAGLPGQNWVKAESCMAEMHELERQMGLMFEAEEMRRVVDERSAADALASLYRKLLSKAARASGREMPNDTDGLERLVDSLARELASYREEQKLRRRE